jgi:hypothetical protein
VGHVAFAQNAVLTLFVARCSRRNSLFIFAKVLSNLPNDSSIFLLDFFYFSLEFMYFHFFFFFLNFSTFLWSSCTR